MRTLPALLALLPLALLVPAAAALSVALPAPGLETPRVDLPPAAPDVALETSALDAEHALPSVVPLVLDVPPTLAEPLLAPRPLLDAAPAAPAPLAPIVSPPAPGTDPASAAAGSVLLWVLLQKLGIGRAGLLLYSRLAPNELLEHERRDRVVQLVREKPGIGPSEIGQALGTSWGVTSYHLEKLERAGLLLSQRTGHHRCYFLPGAVPRAQQPTIAMFRVDTTRRIAEFVAAQPGLTQSQVAAQLGLSASAMSKQVSRLEAAALLRREASGEGQRLFPAAGLTSALA